LPTTLPEPWLSFLKELDPIAGEPTKIPCIGGFAVTQHYGSDRTTVDLDVIDVAPIASRNRLIEAGGKGSPLARKHRVYLDFVGIAQVPYEYEERLVPICEGLFENLHLQVMDPYDIALCKLKRDLDRDFQDMLFLARSIPFDLGIFEQRYRKELRPYLFGSVSEADFTFERWLEAIREDRQSHR
jgi:Nucleotidyltransferase of unknown function (DUF6036)